MISARSVVSALLAVTLVSACDPFSPRGAMKERMAARTAEAPVEFTRTDTVRVYDDADDVAGDLLHDVWYSFPVNGQPRADSLKRTLYVRGEKYKVCYDPQDPDNSTIQLADLACGKVY